MSIRVLWDKNEVALLIEAYEQINIIPSKREQITLFLSKSLRERALKSGAKIDEKFRNYNGIKLRLYEIEYLMKDGAYGIKNTSALFREMVDLYKKNNGEFLRILKAAKEDSTQQISSRKVFNLDEAIVLLNGYLEGRQSNNHQVKIAKQISGQLRQLAKSKGISFDESFRSSSGIMGRLRSIAAIYNNYYRPSAPSTKVFKEAVDLYKNYPDKYKKRLQKIFELISMDDSENINQGANSDDLSEIKMYMENNGGRLTDMKQPSNENEFYEWLSSQGTSSQVPEYKRMCGNISAILLQKGILKKSIYQEDDVKRLSDALDKTKVCFANKKLRIIANNLLTCYIAFLRGRTESQDAVTDDVISKNNPEEVISTTLVIDGTEYSGDKVQEILLNADVEPVSVRDIIESLTGISRGILPLNRWLKGQDWAVELSDDHYIHRESIFEFDEAADIMLKILNKQFLMFSGYTSADVFCDAVSNELSMFLNDNDLNDKTIIVALARHLFVKEQYKGNRFWFYWNRHIFRDKPKDGVSDACILKEYIVNSGGVVTKMECQTYIDKLKIASRDINSLLGIGEKGDVLLYGEGKYIAKETLNIDENFLSRIQETLQLIFNEIPYVIPRQLNEIWFNRLPVLPNGLSWNLLLLQQIVTKLLPEFRVIQTLEGQNFASIRAGIVPRESKIESFSDLLYAVIVVENIEKLPLRFSTGELREFMLAHGLIEGSELFYVEQQKKALDDRRFAWDSNGASVLVLP